MTPLTNRERVSIGLALLAFIVAASLFLQGKEATDTYNGDKRRTEHDARLSSLAQFESRGGAGQPCVAAADGGAGAAVSGATGRLFAGEIVRSFKPPRRFNSAQPPKSDGKNGSLLPLSTAVRACDNWGVLTTINPPTDAVHTLMQNERHSAWCLIVVGDTKTPGEEYAQLMKKHAGRLYYVDADAQRAWEPRSTFVANTPWKHFGRKNLGYLFAAQNGAKVIWDFDDDNEVLPDVEILENGPAQMAPVDPSKCRAYNPYPAKSPPSLPCWPRGLPLDLIKSEECSRAPSAGSTLPQGAPVPTVYQGLAQHDPDVDAIYRLTRELPFNFATRQQALSIPKGVFSPWNAQATLVSREAFWSLYLPTTVNGRVSDIWRSYFAKRIMDNANQTVAFTGPKVVQIRNVHNYIADLDAERHLYERAGALLDFLTAWRPPYTHIPGQLEDLYISLYERDYVEEKDVTQIQNWLQALLAINYAFPPVAAA